MAGPLADPVSDELTTDVLVHWADSENAIAAFSHEIRMIPYSVHQELTSRGPLPGFRMDALADLRRSRFGIRCFVSGM